MSDEVYSLFEDDDVYINSHPIGDLYIFTIRNKVETRKLHAIMDMGWVVMATWIENERNSIVMEPILTNVSFRLGKESMRIILMTNVYLGVADTIIPNLDADEPGVTAELITGITTSIGKLRASALSGYGPYATTTMGLKKPMPVPKLSIVGLDVEVTTFGRNDGMPLPHDEIISIAITNGGWYDRQFVDKCFYIYTFGTCNGNDWGTERNGTAIKANGSADAVRIAYDILNSLNADFVNIHNGFNFDLRALACWSADEFDLAHTFEERRLGNLGVGIFWALHNGSMIVDSIYNADKTSRSDWSGLSLASMCAKFDLPQKLDSGRMDIDPKSSYDHAPMLKYNCRDADMHVWLAKCMMMCERTCVLAGTARSTIWDSVANNTGVMTFSMIQSVALSMGSMLDLGRNTSITDDMKFEGGHVVEPVPGYYYGVVMIDGNSLYGSLMYHLQIFIDRCTSAYSTRKLRELLTDPLPEGADEMSIDDMIWNEHMILMRTSNRYIAVLQGDPTMLSNIIGELISMRLSAKMDKDANTAWAFKQLLVSIYGAMGSKHGIISSVTCAEATTCAARFFLKRMIAVTEATGYKIIYGDTDSIFVWVKGETEDECMSAAVKLKERIQLAMDGTPFQPVGADVKGNYKMVLITSRKKYAMVHWNDVVETKGMAPVKKDVLPIARYATNKVLDIIKRPTTHEVRRMRVRNFIGKLMTAVDSGKLSVDLQVAEVKINCLPHYKYRDAKGEWVTTLVDVGVKSANVNKAWVKERITGAIRNVLKAANIPSVEAMMFSYREEMKLLRRKAASASS